MRRLLPAALMLLAAAGCTRGGGGRAPCPAGRSCLEAGNQSDPMTLDPDKMQLIAEANVFYDTMVGLTTLDARGNTVPGVAQSWDVSPDGLTWRFHLRRALWSDGAPVTARDFVFGFRRLEAPATAAPYAYLLYVLKGAEAVNAGKATPETLGARALDDRTLELTLAHPAADLPLLLVHSSASPIPEHAVARWGDAWIKPGRFVSDGPYRPAAWTLGDRLVLEKNPDFYDAAEVCFDRVSYYPTSDPVTAERRVASGELDMNYVFASNRIGFIRRRLPGYARPSPMLADYYLSFNSEVPALADRRVRLALSMDVDREFITGKLLRAAQAPLYSFVPPGMANYRTLPRPAWASWPFARRQAEARRLLGQAGYGPAHPLRLEFKYANGASGDLAAALQADWRAIGAEVTLSPEDSPVLYSDLNARNFQISLDVWSADFDDATTFLQLLSSAGGAQNHAGYHNPRYDGLLKAADQARDLGRRALLLERAEAVAMADTPVAPLYVESARELVSPAITGFYPNPVDYHPKRFFCRQGARPAG